jgi:hypothetical protein
VPPQPPRHLGRQPRVHRRQPRHKHPQGLAELPRMAWRPMRCGPCWRTGRGICGSGYLEECAGTTAPPSAPSLHRRLRAGVQALRPLIAVLTGSDSVRTSLEGVGLDSRPPPIAPARLAAQPELDFAA